MSEETVSEETVSEGTKLGDFEKELESTLQDKKNDPISKQEMSATKLGDRSEFDQSLVELSETSDTPSQDDNQTKDQGNKSEDFESVFQKEMEKPIVDYNDGDLIKGIIRSVENGGVLVDISYKSDGYIANSELSFDSGFDAKEQLIPGDEISVVIEKLETKEGYTRLSRKRAEILETWESIIQSYKSRESIDVDVTSQVQGGLVIVFKGVKGFVPASQVVMEEGPELDQFVNQSLSVIPIQVDRRRRKFICSHKQSRQSSRSEVNMKLFDELEVGSVCKGKVTSIKDFGVFVDVGGAEGLVHISEMSWSRVTTPSEFINLGDEVDVFVLGVDKENHRISLGMKQLQPDPWVEVIQRFKTGQIVKGTIMRIVPFGAFISIDGLVEGLIHISELSFEHVKTVSDVVSVGQEVEAKIIKLIPEEQKIGLTLKLPKEKGSSETKLSETGSSETDVVPDVVEKKIVVDQDTPPTMETMVKKALDEG